MEPPFYLLEKVLALALETREIVPVAGGVAIALQAVGVGEAVLPLAKRRAPSGLHI
jgi:hypothetical protein